MIRRPSRRRGRLDAAVAADARWRGEGDAVHAAYRAWTAASASGELIAFGAYRATLDSEERAATTHAGLMSRVGHMTETGLAHRVPRLDSAPGAR